MVDVLFFIAGFSGLFCHWLKKWGRKQTDSDFFQYMKNNHKNSIATVSTLVGAIVLLLSSSPELTREAVVSVFLLGFSADSALNK